MQTNRRRFLKLGLIGAIGLAAGGAVYRAVRGPAPLAPFALDGDAALVLGAVIPALLAGALPAEPAARAAAVGHTAERVKGAVRGLPLATQKEVQDLFGLLALAPARRFLAGVSGDWASATPAQVGTAWPRCKRPTTRCTTWCSAPGIPIRPVGRRSAIPARSRNSVEPLRAEPHAGAHRNWRARKLTQPLE